MEDLKEMRRKLSCLINRLSLCCTSNLPCNLIPNPVLQSHVRQFLENDVNLHVFQTKLQTVTFVNMNEIMSKVDVKVVQDDLKNYENKNRKCTKNLRQFLNFFFF